MSKKFLLRINEKLWDELNGWAKDELRSVNGQIEYILRRAVRERKGGPEDAEDGIERRSDE